MTKDKFLKEKKKYDQFCQKITNSLLKSTKQFLDIQNDNIVQLINDQFELSFEDMLLETLNFVTKVYDVNTDWIEISEDIILQLTYSQDGITFKDRVQKHYQNYLKNNNKTIFLNSLQKIINTESKHIFNHEVNNLLTDATTCELVGGDACDDCLDHLGGGKVDIKKLYDLPPYHSNCNCVIVYYRQEDLVDDSWEEDLKGVDDKILTVVQVQS